MKHPWTAIACLHFYMLTSWCQYIKMWAGIVGPLHETSARAVKKTNAHMHVRKLKKASLWLSSGEATKPGKPRNVEISIFVLLALNILPSASIARTISRIFIQSSQKWVISPSDMKKAKLPQDYPFRSIHTTISHFTLSQRSTVVSSPAHFRPPFLMG